MTGRIIQGYFLGGRARIPAVARARGVAQRAQAAQAAGGAGSFQVDGAQLGLMSVGGRPLPNNVRGQMESAFGADFSGVRIHIGPQAERIGALAFATGNDVYFAPGRYQPESSEGRRLLGHELAHVVQQRQGRVRAQGVGGIAVVQDRALEAEADRMAQAAMAVQAKPAGGALQPKAPARLQPASSVSARADGAQQPMRQISGTVQRKGGELLKALAQPQIFPGPEVTIQNEIADELEIIARREFSGLTVFCVGGIKLPRDLPVGGDAKETLIRNVELTEVPRFGVASRYRDIKDLGDLKRKIVRNTITTMFVAGQIEYLRQSGLTRECDVWVEIHYYRDRDMNQSGFHKDTLHGDTLFVNLNFVSDTDQDFLGPEYIVNPPVVPAHEEKTSAALPATFRRHLGKARARLPGPTEIGASTIPANGVVTFVDELIHHATPVYGHRKITGKGLEAFLKQKYPTEYGWAWYARDSGYTWWAAAGIGSWLGSWVSTPVAQNRTRYQQWYARSYPTWSRWLDMARRAGASYDRNDLARMGLPAIDIEELLDRYDPRSDDGTNPREAARYPFERVAIPRSGTTPIRGATTPRLTRRMSVNASSGLLPARLNGKRRFFRTWVRAVKH